MWIGFLAMVPGAWAAQSHHPPRIAVISIELAQQPTSIREAVARHALDMKIDLFGLGAGHLPALETADLSNYDLIVVEGVGPRLAQYRARLEAAAQHTRLLVINGDQWVRGNVDSASVPDAIKYWRNATVENYTRLFDYLGERLLGLSRSVRPPIEYPEHAFYHPEHKTGFADIQSYLDWAAKREPNINQRPRVGIVFYRSLALAHNTAVIDALISETERAGGTPVALWRSNSHDSLRHLSNADGKPAVDVLILCASQIDYASHQSGVEEAKKLGVAVLGCTTDYTRNPEQWRSDPGGFAPDRSGQLALSEANGIIEPMMTGAQVIAENSQISHKPISEQVEWRIARALSWARLHRLHNGDKRLIVTYHSEAADQADVGSDPDTYLDAQASLASLLRQLRDNGYDVGSATLPDAKSLARRMAHDGANISSGLVDRDSVPDGAHKHSSGHHEQTGTETANANDELGRRLAQGTAVAISEEQYLDWYRTLPQALRASTEASWGAPPGRIMVHTDKSGKRSIVIPLLRFGKVALAPHPVWGYLQDAGALTSTDALPPHHQYIAFYLWMNRSYHADAYIPFFTQLSLMPGKQQGPARDDWVGTLIGTLPHIQPAPLQANGSIGNKRRANAVTPGFMPALAQAGLSPDMTKLKNELIAATGHQSSNERQQNVRATAKSYSRELGMDPHKAGWAELESALKKYLDQVEKSVIPVGGHVLGQSPDTEATLEMLHAMLQGDSEGSPGVNAIRDVTQGKKTNATAAQVTRIHDYAARIAAAPREVESLLRALNGDFIEPGPAGDAIRNPDALPPGRNPYTMTTRRLPTKSAWAKGSRLADELIDTYRREHGSAPRKVAFVLWSVESTQNEGVIEAQILRLLGASPIWNPRGEVIDVVLDTRAALGRPRVDVLVTTSGTYRDHFRDKITMLDKAVRLAANSSENDNPVRSASITVAQQLEADGLSRDKAWTRANRRIFSTAPGAYSPSTQFAMKAGVQSSDSQLTQLYTRRLGHAYGENDGGVADSQGFIEQMSTVEAAVFSRSSNTYGLLDTSMPAAYLGGLGMAVREHIGRQIENYVADLKATDAQAGHLEPLARTYGRELQSRYFNPKWIQAMQASGYNGARYMADLPAHLLMWDVTTPELVNDADWAEVKSVYVDDKYGLGMEAYFSEHNPHARQHLLETLLTAIKRGVWQADAADQHDLEQALAKSIVEDGSDCALPSCKEVQLTHMEQPAPPVAQPTAAAAISRPLQGMTQVDGYALEARPSTPAQPLHRHVWLWLLAAVALVAAGGASRPRW